MTKQWTARNWQKVLIQNEYRLIRQTGSHQIWKGADESVISIPSKKINCMLAKRLIKTYNLNVG